MPNININRTHTFEPNCMRWKESPLSLPYCQHDCPSYRQGHKQGAVWQGLPEYMHVSPACSQMNPSVYCYDILFSRECSIPRTGCLIHPGKCIQAKEYQTRVRTGWTCGARVMWLFCKANNLRGRWKVGHNWCCSRQSVMVSTLAAFWARPTRQGADSYIWGSH